MKFTVNRPARRWQFLWIVGSVCLLAGLAKGQMVENCTVDAGAVCQRIDGFGGSSAFVDNWAPAWADLFFSTNTGIGLSLLRTRIPSDGSVPDPDFMQEAQARGAQVWSAPWSPPSAYKEGVNTGTTNGGFFVSADNQLYANQLAGYVANVKTNYGVNLWAISVQNEPDYISDS